MKVVLGLSGGVDSAAAALILKEKGYEVHGVFLDIGLSGADDARDAAKTLGISFETVDIREKLEKHVCKPFVDAYLNGKTPNPCVVCNPAVKFKELFAAADRIGAEYVATGHYARIENGKLLRPSAVSRNDQTYMLCRLPRELLSRIIFPLGDVENKDEVRQMASQAELKAASKPDSMEICFIPEGDHAAYIESRGENLPEGDFIDENGKVLGRHRGIHHYTIGMRRGLRIALGERMFVSKIDRESNTVTLSKGSGVYKSKVCAVEPNLLIDTLPDIGKEYSVRVRHSAGFSQAVLVKYDESGFELEFPEPVRAPAPGQSAVLYDGDVVVCSGFII